MALAGTLAGRVAPPLGSRAVTPPLPSAPRPLPVGVEPAPPGSSVAGPGSPCRANRRPRSRPAPETLAYPRGRVAAH